MGIIKERLRLGDRHETKFTTEFRLGDTVYWLGHDGVHGFWHGEAYVADEDMIKYKDELKLYKKL